MPGYGQTPAKIEALDGLLHDLVEVAGEKVVLWSFYRASLDRLAARYAHLGLVRVDGSVTDSAQRREAVRSFQEDPGTRVFLGNPAAAGAGLTLHTGPVLGLRVAVQPGSALPAEPGPHPPAGIWAFLGGQPEVLTLPGSAVMWLLAYGKTTPGVERNPRATRFADTVLPGFVRGDMIMGPALVVGFDDEGLAADVPVDMERAALGQ